MFKHIFNVRFLIFHILETYFDISFLSKYIIVYSIFSDIIYSFSNFNIRKLTSIYFYLSMHIFSAGDTLGVRVFTAF